MKRGLRYVCLAVLATIASPVAADTPIAFALDWKFEGPSAPFFVALEKGFYRDAGLDVRIDPGKGSIDGIRRVASGSHQIGSADLNSLIRYLDRHPEYPAQAVMIYYDEPPFAIATLEESNIRSPKDLEGRILGAPANDGAHAQWEVFSAANGIDQSLVRLQDLGFAIREPMLAAGKVDAITGYSFTMVPTLRARGIAESRIRVMRMSHHGLTLYGNAIIVDPSFAAAHPDAVRGFVAATIAGIRSAVADPKSAVEYVLAHNRLADRDTELVRLRMAIGQNIVTPWVKTHGIGDIDRKRLEHSIEQIGTGFIFARRPGVGEIFTSAYLPPKSKRMID